MALKKFLLTTLMIMMLMLRAEAAPTVELSLRDDVKLYSPELIASLNDQLRGKLNGSFEFTDAPDYKIEVLILNMGIGKLVNNGLATTISLGGSFASLFVEPLSGSSLGALGWVHATKPVFAISVHVKVIRNSDGAVMYSADRLGRSNIAKKDERPPLKVIEDAIDDTVETIAKPLIKDSARSKPRVFK